MSSLKETKELLKFVIDLGLAVEKSLEDGDLSIFDAANFVSSMIDIGPAFCGIEKVPEEIRNMGDPELKEIQDYIQEQLNLSDNVKLADAVAKLAEVGLKIFQLVTFIQENRKSSTGGVPSP